MTDPMSLEAMKERHEREKKRPRWDAPKQEHGEFEVEDEPSLTGLRHAHFLFVKGRWDWVIRSGERRSPLCGTTRCRMIAVSEVPRGIRIGD